MARSRPEGPEKAEETQSAQGSPPSLWRDRDYLYWWSGNGLSTLGTSVSTLAFPLLMLYTTGSATQAGTITVLHMLGKLATLAVGGALADRVSRRAILCLVPLAEAASMAAVALLVYRGDPSVLALDALALVGGLAAGLKIGVSTPVLRRIVPKEQIADATAQSMGRDMVVQLVGAPLGGLLYSMARWIPFLFDAVSFVFITLSSLLIRRPLGPDRRADGERRTGLAADMRDGLRLIRRSDYLVFTLAWGALLNTVAQGLTLLFIVLVRHRGGGPTAVGVATSLAVAGGVIGAVAGPWLMRRLGARRVLLLSAWVFVASFAVVALVPQPWQIGLVLMFGMTSMVPMNVVIESYEVRLVPDAYLGRVAATGQFFFQAMQWIGPLAAGVLADALGVEAAVLILAVAMALLAIALHTARRQLSVLDIPLAEVAELPAPPPAAGRPSEPEPDHPHAGGSTLKR
ncbi:MULTISPECIES: MFS transporter [Streptomyces]|uniref:MFS transporter n=1 Tax=Streptomyces lonegramiae TaxID=3075524 RepID=A0ABU2XA88_9ACTN|nr:MFS transporter [Streptomyces sp. DSM 41529]MDT0542829.1 MFS transporter [Streptomyces sp. DSM 41529]